MQAAVEGHVIHGLGWNMPAPEGVAASVPMHVAHIGQKQQPHGQKVDMTGHSSHVGEAWQLLMAQCAHRLVLAQHERDVQIQALPARTSLLGTHGLPAANKDSVSGPEVTRHSNVHVGAHVGAVKAFFPSPSGTLLHGFIPRVLSEVCTSPGSPSRDRKGERKGGARMRARSFKHVPLTNLLGTPVLGHQKSRESRSSHLRGLGVRVRMLGKQQSARARARQWVSNSQAGAS